MSTRYQLHLQTWDGCTRCDLHKYRTNMVFARGESRAQVVFIGEAPGDNEDSTGVPFVGRAGEKLDEIIELALGNRHTYAITNLVCCLPPYSQFRDGRQPLPEEVDACKPRLVEFISIADPRLIVCVGKQAATYLDTKVKGHHTFHRPYKWIDPTDKSPEQKELFRCGTIGVVDIVHPAWILRQKTAYQDGEVRKCVMKILAVLSVVFSGDSVGSSNRLRSGL